MRVTDQRGWKAGVWCAALLAAAGWSQPAVRAQGDDEAVKKDIQAALDRGAAALAAKDLEAYGKELAAEYRSTSLFGETAERDKALEQLKGMIEPAENIKATSTVESLKVKDDQATVLVRMKGSADVKDQDGKTHPVRIDQREVQTWAKTADGWRLKDSMEVSSRITMDDKPFAPETKEEDAATREAIQGVYDSMAKAMLAGDADALGKSLPEEFVMIPIGEETGRKRDEFLAEVKKDLATPPAKMTAKIERAVVNGDRAVVITSVEMEADRQVEGAKKHTTASWIERDVWKKTDSGWAPVEFRPLYREMTQEGKGLPVSYATPPKRA